MPKIIHAELSDKIGFDLKEFDSTLKRFIAEVEDANDFEDLLNKSILSFYLHRPNGAENYGHAGKIGRIYLSRISASSLGKPPGYTLIEYSPSLALAQEYGSWQKTLGIINLRKRSCELTGLANISEILAKDTEYVMFNDLGLKRG